MQLNATSPSVDSTGSLASGNAGAANDLSSICGAAPAGGPFSDLLGASSAPTPAQTGNAGGVPGTAADPAAGANPLLTTANAKTGQGAVDATPDALAGLRGRGGKRAPGGGQLSDEALALALAAGMPTAQTATAVADPTGEGALVPTEAGTPEESDALQPESDLTTGAGLLTGGMCSAAFALAAGDPAQADPAGVTPPTAGAATGDATRLMRAYGPFVATEATPSPEPDGATAAGSGQAVAPGLPATTAPWPTAGQHDDLAVDNATTEAVGNTPQTAGASAPTGRPNLAQQNDALAAAATANPAAAEGAPGAPENFAATAVPRPTRVADAAQVAIKKSLSSDSKDITKQASSLGTGVAKSDELMPNLTDNASSAPATPGVVHVTNVVPATSFETLTKEAPQTLPGDTASAAHAAVQAVLDVADRATSASAPRAVDLQFSVSGVDLSVRVELRGDAVHTTFRTDSPELRSALANEWQAVTTGSAGDRGQRLADPVFTAAGSSGAGSSGTTADQRDAGTRQQTAFSENNSGRAPSRSRAATASPVNSPAVASTTTVTRSAPLALPGRLHAFA